MRTARAMIGALDDLAAANCTAGQIAATIKGLRGAAPSYRRRPSSALAAMLIAMCGAGCSGDQMALVARRFAERASGQVPTVTPALEGSTNVIPFPRPGATTPSGERGGRC